MGLKLSSIKFQIIVAFTLLAVPVAMLAYFIFNSHQSFVQNVRGSIAQRELTSLTASVERDVVDLQRNVLIFKETASSGAVKNVEKLYDNINQSIKTLVSADEFNEYGHELDSILRHLGDYKSNFDVVVDYREQRQALVREYLDDKGKTLLEAFVFSGLSADTIEDVQVYILSGYSSSLSYLATNDSQAVKKFKQEMALAREVVSESAGDLGAKESYRGMISNYENNFLRIFTLTRNYNYLINVVMAGSAREILYLSADLAKASSENVREIQTVSLKGFESRQQWVFVLSCMGLLLAVVVPVYFFVLITKPIESITQVFNDISDGKSVTQIPGRDREDEIGFLAKAADVFKEKNEQTIALLRQTEHSVKLQQQLNQELSDAKTSAEEALSVKTDFLANMSHELRTPLNSVIGYTVRLLKKPESFNERQLLSLRTIERNGRHLLAMINDILDFSKIEADMLDMNFESVEICALCRDLVEQIRSGAEEKGLDLQLSLPAESLDVETDEVRLAQVLINLLSNSVKYTEHGGVKLLVSVDEQHALVRFEVHDTGIGIEEDDMTRLFNRFEQFDNRSKFKIGHGTGLGLAIVANLARLLGAQVQAHSVYGQGSCFAISMPFEHGDSVPEAPQISDFLPSTRFTTG